MFTLGFNEFIRNIRKNIWVIFELVLLFMLGIFMVSTVSEQMRTYKPVRGTLDETGMLVYGFVPTECFDGLKGVENIVKVPYFGYSGKKMCAEIVSDYPDYKMKLTSGKYCTTENRKDGMVRVMACDSTGLKAGDVFEIKGEDYYVTTVYVTGTFDADEWVFGFFRGGGVSDYKVLFGTYNSEADSSVNRNYYLFVANAEDMEREIECGYNYALIDFDDDISEEDMEYNKALLTENRCLEGLNFKSTRDMYVNTKNLMEIKIVPIGIAFVIVFIFSIFSIIAASSVSFKYERRNYGIYFLTGNTWKNTILLTIVHWGIAIGSSLFIAVCLSLILGKTGILSDFNLEFSVIQICVIAGIIVIQLLMALIIPWRMLRKTEPVTIIKESER